MENAGSGKKILMSLIIALVAIAIFVGIGAVFSMIGIPLWPFVFFMFFYTSIDKFDRSKFWPTAVGGLVGTVVGMSQGIVTELSGSSVAGIAVFAVLAVACVTLFIMGNVRFVNVLTLLLITLITVFTFTAGDLAGSPASSMGYVESFIRVVGSYALSVVLFMIINSIMARKTAQKLTRITE